MANAVYPKYKQSYLTEADTNNGLNTTGTTGTFCALMSATYVYSSSHQFYSSLSGIVGTDQEITTPTVTNGTFDGDNLTFSAVTGSAVTALLLYRKNAGANTTWRLVLYMDTGVTGLPVTPNGGDIQVSWNGSGIFTSCLQSLKQDIVSVGRIGPIGVYEYSYIGDDRTHRRTGFMAHEVKHYLPEAVREIYGIDRVNFQTVIEKFHLS